MVDEMRSCCAQPIELKASMAPTATPLPLAWVTLLLVAWSVETLIACTRTSPAEAVTAVSLSSAMAPPSISLTAMTPLIAMLLSLPKALSAPVDTKLSRSATSRAEAVAVTATLPACSAVISLICAHAPPSTRLRTTTPPTAIDLDAPTLPTDGSAFVVRTSCHRSLLR